MVVKKQTNKRDGGFRLYSNAKALKISPPEYFECYVDRAKYVLNDSLEGLVSKKTWFLPFGITFTIFLALLTSDFRNFFGISASDWRLVFIVLFVLSFFYGCSRALVAYRSRNISLEKIITRMRDGK